MPSERTGRSFMMEDDDFNSSQQPHFPSRTSRSLESSLFTGSTSNNILDSDSSDRSPRSPFSSGVVARGKARQDPTADESFLPSSMRSIPADDTEESSIQSAIASVIAAVTTGASSMAKVAPITTSTVETLGATVQQQEGSEISRTVAESAADVPPTKLRTHQVVVFVPGVDSRSTESDDEEGALSSSTSTHDADEPIYEAELATSSYGDLMVERVVKRLIEVAPQEQSGHQIDDDSDNTSKGDGQLRNKPRIAWLFIACILGVIAIIASVLVTQLVGGRSTRPSPTTSPSTSSPELQPPTPAESPVISSPTSQPTSRAQSTRGERLKEILGSVLNAEILNDPESAQYKALRWLLTDDEYVLNNSSEVIERFVLTVFYFSMQWPSLEETRSPFLVSNTHHCDWKGNVGADVLECNQDNLVTIVDFELHNLIGTVPTELQHLSMLQVLKLSNQEITGTVPSELGTLIRLTHLDLSYNQLRGSIPSSLFSLFQLRTLGLHWNSLTGTIPPNIGECRRLEFLYLYANGLVGLIPSSINDLALLDSVELNDNGGLYGPIPSFSNSQNLRRILLGGNAISGTIPIELFSNPKVTTFSVYSSELQGTVPTEIGLWTDLKLLWLEDNQLKGPFPPLTTHPDLEDIHLNGNNFTGRLDQLLEGLPQKLKDGRFDGNKFTGTIPEGIGSRSLLTHFGVGDNLLSGTMPSELGLLTLATVLDLYSNHLDGTLPTELGGLGALSRLRTKSNQLEGTLPSEFGRLTQLTWLEVNNNNFGGSIPSEFGGMMDLTYLDICCNNLNETIPTELSTLSKLSQFYLEENTLTGQIPESWSRSTFPLMTYFYFYENNLTGDLNQGFCNDVQETSLVNIGADCLGPDAEVECSCCSECCDRDDNCVTV